MILNNASSFKGTNRFINEDYSKETVAIKKEKWKKIKQLQEQGKDAVLVYSKVVTREKSRILFTLFYSRIFEILVTSL